MAKRKNIGDLIIHHRRDNKLTYNAISDLLGCAKSTVQYHCEKMGLTDIGYNIEAVPDNIKAEINEYRKTHTIKESAEFFNLSESTIKNHQNKKAL